jgi:hypothetical protein
LTPVIHRDQSYASQRAGVTAEEAGIHTLAFEFLQQEIAAGIRPDSPNHRYIGPQ